jgi:hypothetical protein
MAFRINPAFRRFPTEAALIGRILAAFGEIEVSVCRNAAQSLQMYNTIMKTLYGIGITSSRIETANRLMRETFESSGLTDDHDTAMGLVRHCLKIRNQFAHCNWADHDEAGLFFADLQASAEKPDFSHNFKHVDPALLQQQEDYFGVTMEQLEWLNQEIAVRQGRLRSHFWQKPIIPTPPPLHNPADQHVPPWLSEDQKALHLARALARQGGAPTPTPGQIALDKARAEVKERRRAHAERAQKAI